MPTPGTKPVIAVDIDDVISSQNEDIRLFANQKYGYNHSPEDYKVQVKGPYWAYWGYVWGVSNEEHDRRVESYFRSGGLFKQEPVPGAIEALKKLKRNYKLVVVTSRRDGHVEDTHKWLDKHFKSVFEDVRFAKFWESGKRESKADICRELGAAYLIDDYSEHCNIAAEAGIEALLFGDFGWNKGVKLHPEVTKVADWQEVLEYFSRANFSKKSLGGRSEKSRRPIQG
jgi:phosphoglycolate phosphatase-like HAD superfamily hydrolase